MTYKINLNLKFILVSKLTYSRNVKQIYLSIPNKNLKARTRRNVKFQNENSENLASDCLAFELSILCLNFKFCVQEIASIFENFKN